MEIDKLIPKSKYYDGPAEGIVLKNMTRKNPNHNCQLYAKLVRDEFKECNRAVFGNIKNKNSDTSKIVEQFITDARIRKNINKLVNEENKKLERGLMKFLPNMVIKDMLKEEFTNVYEQYKFIDFTELRVKATKRCLHVLDEYMLSRVK
jgi:hypothetical protein